MDMKYVVAWYNRGLAKKHSEDYKGAIEDYNQTIVLDPKYSDAYNSRGLARYELNDHAGACADFKKAIELGNEYAPENLKKFCN
jgi:tetratricopeptide (TPR) repeat protein